MKLVKLSVLALAMGLFVASCGNGNGDAPKTDTATPPPAAPPATPPPADTTAKPADTTKPADAAKPADVKMEEKKEEKKK